MDKKHSVDICYVISHGFAARMLLQTNLIQRLLDAGKKIAIITPDVDDENFRALKSNENISIFDSEIKQNIWDDDYAAKRMYFPSIRTRFKRNEYKYLVSKKASNLIQKINPKMVVSTYPVNFLEAKFMYAAKEQKIKTVIHLLSWDNVTSKGIFPVIPDEFIAWGKVMQQEMKEYYGTAHDKIHVCGVPHFDQHIQVKRRPQFQKILKEIGLNVDLPYLFVAMSSPRFAPHGLFVHILKMFKEV